MSIESGGKEECYMTSLLTKEGKRKEVVHCLSGKMEEVEKARKAEYTGSYGDRKVGREEMENEFVPCRSRGVDHLFKQTTATSYVRKGEEDFCDSLPGKSLYGRTYTCNLDTKKAPVSHFHDGKEWWRWERDTAFECEGGWNCKEEGRKKEHTCSLDSDCKSGLQAGVCGTEGVCTLGASGSRCSNHEDCDVVSVGKCGEGGRCSNKSGVKVEYYAPKACSSLSSESKYTYCGNFKDEEGEERFTGVCEPVGRGGGVMACKPFEDEREMYSILKKEEDWQSLNKQHVNNFSERPAWERTSLCEMESLPSGRKICRHSTEKIPLTHEVEVTATSLQEARQLCPLSHTYVTLKK
jgi:hypothetical protein